MKWFLLLFCAQTALGGTLYFQSGPDTACSRNCLYVSANEGPFKLLGCNKSQLGRCRSSVGKPTSMEFQVLDQPCQKLRLKVLTQGKDGGRPHFSFDSAEPGRNHGQDYLVNSRTPNRVDLWLNDNDDRDPYDLRVTLASDDPFAIPGLDKVSCR